MSPRGIPRINSRRAEPDPMPATEVLGTVKPEITQPGPLTPHTLWTGPGGSTIDLTEAPPPWEIAADLPGSDARRFVDVPNDWTLRWINRRMLDTVGWRHWQPVMASDPRVTVKVSTMVSPENNLCRGGSNGDLLAWMPTHWVESRRRHLQERTARMTQGAMDRQESLRDEFKRGKYGSGVSIEEARHPTHTIADGRTMKDN